MIRLRRLFGIGALLLVMAACTPAGDSTKPTVALSASSTNVTAAGDVTLTASAADNVGVTKVEFYDGSSLIGTKTTSPYTQTVSFTVADNGSKSYTAKAFDAAGNSETSAAIAVTVNITVADTTPPTIVSTNPANGATDIAVNSTVVVTFSEAMNVATVAANLSPSLSLGTPVFSAGNTVATFTPISALSKGTAYTLTVSGQDLAGNSLSGTTTATFTTVPDVSGLYVANASQNRITVYTKDVGGNIVPIRNISGAQTQLSFPYGMDLDTAGNLYVASYNAGKVLVFAPAATGNVAPVRTISGALTGITNPTSLLVVGNELYVSDDVNAIFVFPLTANGNVAPTRKIQGAGTTLTSPRFMAVSGTNIFVSDEGTNSIKVFNNTSNGNVAPDRQIVGATTTLSGPAGLAIFGGELYVANFAGSTVAVFPTTASGDVAPSRSIAGANTTLSNPVGMATDPTGNLLIGSNGKVLTFGAGNSGNIAPIRTLTGANTLLGSVRGILYRP